MELQCKLIAGPGFKYLQLICVPYFCTLHFLSLMFLSHYFSLILPSPVSLLPLFLSGSCSPDNDAPLLSLAVETPPLLSGQGGTGVVSAGLQWVLQHWVAEPVVEKRRVIVGERQGLLILC